MSPVVGVGASAGGLEAMLPLFSNISPEGQAPIVVAQHMAPQGHDERIVRLLRGESGLPVCLGHHGMALEPNRVHVIPSGHNGAIRGGTLWLTPPTSRQLSTPSVDHLFHSIAEVGQSGALGIVLSGAGQDGRLGCRAIREVGGWTLAQSPAEARFNSMPLAALEDGAIDQVLCVQDMGKAMAERWQALGRPCKSTGFDLPPLGTSVTEVQPSIERNQALLRPIVSGLAHITGTDFSGYKADTLWRRLDKRRTQLGLNSWLQYQAHLVQQPGEWVALQRLFLVSVSWFYRDSGSFDALQAALANRVCGLPADTPLQIWVPACASGEEAYTLAMLAQIVRPKAPIPARVCGTDLNPSAIEQARAGRYRAQTTREMPQPLQQRYLKPLSGDWEILPALREWVGFQCADVLTHEALSFAPAQTPLDLISCRNLFIYLETPLQDRLLARFAELLKPGGLLFLGQSESMSATGHSWFVPVDAHHRIYRRRP